MTLTGYLTPATLGKLAVKNNHLTVTNTDLTAVGTAPTYADLKISYSAKDVGLASISKTGTDTFSATAGYVLSAYVADGDEVGLDASDPGLSSLVNQKGTLAALNATLNPTAFAVPSGFTGLVQLNTKVHHAYTTTGTGNWDLTNAMGKEGAVLPKKLRSAIFGAVGSAARIAATTTISGGATIQMGWRSRTAAEAYLKPGTLTNGIVSNSLETVSNLPNELYLISDVLKVGSANTGELDNVTYGLQMTYDPRILQAMDGVATTQHGIIVEENAADSNKWDWVDGHDSHVCQDESLDTFLSANITDLETSNPTWTRQQALNAALTNNSGAFGVDTTTDPNHPTAWVIVKGGGVFAVVPEPATIVMMVSATLGAMAYGWRRWSRKSRLPA